MTKSFGRPETQTSNFLSLIVLC